MERKPDVALKRCQSYHLEEVRAALVEVLAPFGGLSWARPGMRVALKTNLLTGAHPDAAVTTHPAVLTALTELLIERGAEVVIGDSPGGPFTSAIVGRAYALSGLAQCEAAGARLNRNFAQAEARFDAAVSAKSFSYTAYLDEADVILNVCKLKTHGMMGMTAAVKNLFGTVPGTVKTEYHYRFPEQRAFANMLVDLNEYFRPRLNIVDAVVGMEGNGPARGKPRAIGCLLAAESPYAADLACASILGLTADDVPTLRVAAERGLAPDDAAALAVVGDAALADLRVPDFVRSNSSSDLQFGSGLPGPLGKAAGALVRRALASVPACQAEACTGCGRCASVCPAHAIEMRGGLPAIRRGACIRCFCCQEFCPAGAMRVRRPWLARALNPAR